VRGEVKMKSSFNACCALCALVLGAVGCAEPEVHTERAVIADAVQSLTVDVGSGDVHVRGDDVQEVNVIARVEGASNHLGHALTGGKLSLVDDCHENHCSVDIDVVVPAGVAVEVHTGSGDIALAALLGSILVRTGSGDVLGSELAGVGLSVETGSGDVTLGVSEPAERIHVETHAGDIALGVPSGRYRLNVATLAGDAVVRDVSNDASAPASLEAITRAGDVAVRGH
jgi:hypothetical protein